MKKCLTLTFVSTAVIGLTLSFAGPERYESKEVQPMPAPACDWSGFYIGLNVGGANFQAKFTDLDYFEGYDTRVFEDENFIGGGQVGYNWQNGAFVFGIEADGAYLNTEVHTHTIFANINDTNPSFQEDNAELNFLGTVRGRAGLGVQNALIYVTAGVAFAHGNWQEKYFEPEPGENPNFGAVYWNGDDWRVGWTAGVGAEYMVNCHWTVRLETLYTNFQDDTVHGQPAGSREGDARDRAFRYTFDDELWTVRLGLNYKFGGRR